MVLRREIGAHRVNTAPSTHPWDPVQVWVADDSHLGSSIDHNQRAIDLCRDHGFDVQDAGGVAVIISYDPSTGESVDPPAEVLAHLDSQE